MHKTPDIYAWCDGSYRIDKSGQPRIGGGFIVRETDSAAGDKHCSIRFNALKDSHRHGSLIAEINAVSQALRQAPKNRHIHIYNDNMQAVKALKRGYLTEKETRKSGRDLRIAFNRAMFAMQRYEQVTISHCKRDKPMMQAADRLARYATRPHTGRISRNMVSRFGLRNAA